MEVLLIKCVQRVKKLIVVSFFVGHTIVLKSLNYLLLSWLVLES